MSCLGVLVTAAVVGGLVSAIVADLFGARVALVVGLVAVVGAVLVAL